MNRFNKMTTESGVFVYISLRTRERKVQDKYCIVHVYLRRLTIHQKGRKINISWTNKLKQKAWRQTPARTASKQYRKNSSTSMSKVEYKRRNGKQSHKMLELTYFQFVVFVCFIRPPIRSFDSAIEFTQIFRAKIIEYLQFQVNWW